MSLFKRKDSELIAAYRDLNQMPQWRHIAADLAKFCRAHETTFTNDPLASANLQGRREVWLHLQRMVGLTDEELMQILQNQLETLRANK